MSPHLRHLPNVISVARVLLVGPIIWGLLQHEFTLAICLFLIAGASDGLDGFLAKRYGWSSRLGGILDALADKFLLVSTFACLWWLGLFPWWLVLSVLVRDLIIVIGVTIYNFRIATVQPEPSLVSKLNTFLQIALAAVGVAQLGFGGFPDWLIQALIWAVMSTILLSGAGYVRDWSRRARGPRGERARMTERYRWWLFAWLFFAGLMLYLLSPILTPFVVSALLAYLGDPLVDRLEARGIKRTPAVVLVFMAIFLLLALLLVLLLPQVESQVSQLVQRLPRYIEWLRTILLPHVDGLLPGGLQSLDPSLLPKALAQHWREAGGVLAGVWGSVAGSGLALLAWLGNLVLIPVLTFYLLRDWDELVAGVHALLPRRSEATVDRLARESDEVLGGFLRGQVSVMFALGAIYTTGLWLIGLDFALLIGMLAGLVSFVPYLGLIVGILIAGLASILQVQGLADLPWVVLVFVVGQLLEGTVLTPRLVGERIGLHPVAVIFAVLAGGQLYGFFGILLALPVAAVAMVLLRHMVASYRASPLYGHPLDESAGKLLDESPTGPPDQSFVEPPADETR